MRKISRHAEWLNLVERSGPFLVGAVLDKVFPQGLDAIETPRRKLLRAAYDEWTDAVWEDDPQVKELHWEWIRLVLTEMLDFDDTVLFPYDGDESTLTYISHEHTGSFAPDFTVRPNGKEKPLLLVSIQPPGTDLEKVRPGDGWPASIVERMTLLCRSAEVRLGLVTDGERWMLVNAPVGITSSHTSWYARLWFQEPVTLKAFQSLLGVRRWFGPEEETLPAMLEESLQYHEEVTDTLGEQVRRAVEVLVQCLDKADQDRNRELLRDVPPAELYEAGLTVMMRLVFVLCAEERGLLLLGDPTYDQHYAITTMRGKLAEEADRHGSEVLERRHDAWSRLLSVFRAVYSGVEHEAIRMPAMGGSLFDPDRFPFLEGRAKGTHWRDMAAKPLPIDNRTVFLLLSALQVLEQRGGALLLSYKALDVEQIGHVYEGLLEHTVQRLPQVTLGLEGSQKAKNPNITLGEMESASLDGEKAIVDLVKDATHRSDSAIENALKKDMDDETFGRVISICGGDMELATRIRPFAHLLRTDEWGDFIVYRANSFAVTLGADRRETGTHYTPKSLTESIVETTLEPVAYVGPAEGTPRDQWQLKSSAELLDLKICDPAMGSGAFLVQVCRWLSERLVEAWGKEMADGKFITVDGIALDEAGGAEPMPDSLDERLLIARRLVAERCLYGVDMNPLAVELAKLSIWLVTLAKGRPFGFLDHNLRCGDSLLGLHKLEQLFAFDLKAETGTKYRRIFAQQIETQITEAMELRKKLRETPIRDIGDVQYMERLDKEAKKKLENMEHIADAMIGEALVSGGNAKTLETSLDNLATWAAEYIQSNDEIGKKIIAKARKALSIDLPAGKPPRKPFHWALVFPEVFKRGGFDGIVGNPPFMGGKILTTALGSAYASFLRHYYFKAFNTADLCSFFFQRSFGFLKKGGCMGLLATNSLCQGDTAECGLGVVIDWGGCIYNAESSFKWPGSANVFASRTNIIYSNHNGLKYLDGETVEFITHNLTTGAKSTGPLTLKLKPVRCMVGSFVRGDGFILSPNDEIVLLANKNNRDVIFPYLNGKDLYASSNCEAKRKIINFFDWDINVASKYQDVFRIVKEKVLPVRQVVKEKGAREKWWQYAGLKKELYDSLTELEYVLVRARVSDTHAIVLVNANQVFSDQIVVFPTDSPVIFCVLQSSLHEVWVRRYSSTLKGDQRYSPSACFDNFPFPILTNISIEIGKEYIERRQQQLDSYDEGMTSFYKRIHNPDEPSEDIQKLRDLHIEMDNAVAAAFGLDDLDLGHGFHATKQGKRLTISEDARREVLHRLLKLNHERYEGEVNQGLHDKKKKTKKSCKKKKTPPKDDVNMDLFNFNEKS